MKVYVLTHDEGYEGSEVRGIYATRELAEEALVWSEYRRDSDTGHEWWSWHTDFCCGVDEMDVLDRVELPFHGPENIDTRKYRGGWVVPEAFLNDIAIFSAEPITVTLVDSNYLTKDEL